MFKRLSVLPSITKRLASTFTQGPLTRQFPQHIISKITPLQTPSPQSIISQITPRINNNISSPLVEKIDIVENDKEYLMTSVLRKRRLAMKKHKLRKRRKAQRALKIKLG
ncbi:hypothetical protein CANARDRAFT_26906, partial [[Candida] arabinofermentans NRRL YB-2248]